jgi:hypothetical protein
VLIKMEKLGTSVNGRRRYNGSFIGAHRAFTKVDENQNQDVYIPKRVYTPKRGGAR